LWRAPERRLKTEQLAGTKGETRRAVSFRTALRREHRKKKLVKQKIGRNSVQTLLSPRNTKWGVPTDDRTTREGVGKTVRG